PVPAAHAARHRPGRRFDRGRAGRRRLRDAELVPLVAVGRHTARGFATPLRGFARADGAVHQRGDRPRRVHRSAHRRRAMSAALCAQFFSLPSYLLLARPCRRAPTPAREAEPPPAAARAAEAARAVAASQAAAWAAATTPTPDRAAPTRSRRPIAFARSSS